jgi:hypothetical protein
MAQTFRSKQGTRAQREPGRGLTMHTAATLLDLMPRINLYKQFPRSAPDMVAEVCREHGNNEQTTHRALNASRTNSLAAPLDNPSKQAILARFPAHEPASPSLECVQHRLHACSAASWQPASAAARVFSFCACVFPICSVLLQARHGLSPNRAWLATVA